MNLIAKRKLRSPLKWHGGKNYLARRIIALMPKHEVYNEPYAGGLNVLLNKTRATMEFASDIHPGLILFWRVVASIDDSEDRRYWAMEERLRFNKYSAETFVLAKHFIDYPLWPLDQIDRAEYAAFFLMKNRMSRGGLGKDFAWSERLRGGQPGDLNAWQTCIADLRNVHARMRGVTVWCKPAIDQIRDTDSAVTLHYCDPPYLHETRRTRDAYEHEMSRDQHIELIDTLNRCKGAVLLSGYQSALYETRLSDGWECRFFDMPNHSGQSKIKQRRVECLWFKPATETHP